MHLIWRAWRLCSVALLLTVPGLISPVAKAQLSELDPKAKAGLASCSQAPPDAPWASFLNCPDLEVPRFAAGNNDYPFFELVNLDQRVDPMDDLPTKVLPSIPHADAASQVLSVARVDADWPGAPSAAPPPPDPPNPSAGGWRFGIAPYLWFAGIHGTVGALGHEGSVHASFRDIFSHFNIGLMFALEPRYNRIVMPFDFMWMKVSDDKALPFEVGPTSVKAKINEIMLTQKIGYRLIDTEKLKVDGLAGFRYWHMGNTLTLQPQTANGFYASANWVDAVGGARFQAMLSPKIILTVLGDAGGGGANSDYQVAGLLGWKFKKFALQGGWRYMSVNYRSSGSSQFVYDMATSGLILGVTIPLK